MNKWFVILVLIFILFGACTIVSHFAAPEMAATARYGMEIQATAAAATPDAVQLLDQNRASLEAAGAGSGSGAAWIGFAVFLMVIVLLGFILAFLVAAPNTLKQGRLAYKTIGGGRTRRPNPGRIRTIPNVPHMRQLPARSEPEEVGYDL
jgi:hypothetical protein